ncbi:hypothetical protein WH47_08080, partial [Habropoda laboriosa]
KHMLVPVPSIKKDKCPTKKCLVCAANNKRSETRYNCKLCDVASHLGIYFTKYHTLKKF